MPDRGVYWNEPNEFHPAARWGLQGYMYLRSEAPNELSLEQPLHACVQTHRLLTTRELVKASSHFCTLKENRRTLNDSPYRSRDDFSKH